MKRVIIEKFLADYENAINAREEIIANKEIAIAAEKEKAEQVIVANGYSDSIKEKLISLVVEDKEKEFDTTELDSEIAGFEKYIEDIEEETCENEEVENTEMVENTEEEINFEAPTEEVVD